VLVCSQTSPTAPLTLLPTGLAYGFDYGLADALACGLADAFACGLVYGDSNVIAFGLR